MKTVTREQLKQIFKKCKNLRIPQNLDQIDFENLKYYAWLDSSDQVVFMVYDYNGERTGIKWETLRMSKVPLKRGFCEICHKHRPTQEILLVTSKTRKLPKGISYRSRGNYICSNFTQCNADMKDETGITSLFRIILAD